ncbi:hypothetical protein Ahia01_001192700, partial [Argonauta hians]
MECEAGTSSDGMVGVKEEPLEHGACDMIHFENFEIAIEGNDDDDDDINDDNDDDDDNETSDIGRYQIKSMDSGDDDDRSSCYDAYTPGRSTPHDTSTSLLSPSSIPDIQVPCNVGESGNSSESLIRHNIQNFDTELTQFLSGGAEDGASGGCNKALVNAKTCLFLNNIYQAVIQENLLKLQMDLIQNREKQKAVKEELDKCSSSKKPKRNVFNQPYFLSPAGMPPANEHTKILKPWQQKQIQRGKVWKKWEQDLLVNAVRENALEIVLRPFMNKIETYTDKLLTSKESSATAEIQRKLEQLRREMAEAEQSDINLLFEEEDFEDKLDWMKISNLTFSERHTDFSCRLMWRNWLRPSINKKPWLKTETTQLRKLVEQHGRHQWQQIAKELNTKRTPMHCLQHYRRELDAYSKQPWTEEEDKILGEVVETCRIGNRIPWNQVSFYMEGRSNASCSARWTVLDPSIKHGRWTQEEDSVLVAAVQILGTNKWQYVQKLVPNRKANQCRERWVNCLDPGINFRPFTYEEDKFLLKFVQKNGTSSWAALAAQMEGRTDQLCSTQYGRLKKWQEQANYVNGQTTESKNFFIHDFDANKFADLVEAGNSLDVLIPLPGLPKSAKKLEGVISKWRQENLKRDLVKQVLDVRKGDIYVPRPPLLRKNSPNVTKLWDSRNQLRQKIEQFVQSQMVAEGATGKLASSSSSTKASSLLSSRLDQLKPNSSVSQILRLARGISQQPKKKPCFMMKPQMALVDQHVKDLLYVHWLGHNHVHILEPFKDEFLVQTTDQKGRSRLRLLHLFVNALGPRSKIYQKVLSKRNSALAAEVGGEDGAEHPEDGPQKEDFRLMFLRSFDRGLGSVNFSYERVGPWPESKAGLGPSTSSTTTTTADSTATTTAATTTTAAATTTTTKASVKPGDMAPPNLTTVNAIRLLLQDRPRLRKQAESYDEVLQDDPDTQSLREKMNLIKVDTHYSLLQERVNTLFMWPALLSTLNPKKRGSNPTRGGGRSGGGGGGGDRTKQTNTKGRRKGIKKRKYPMTLKRGPKPHNYGQSSKVPSDPQPGTSETMMVIKSEVLDEDDPASIVPQKRRRGRPVGAKTKRKVVDKTPVRASRRLGKHSKSPDNAEDDKDLDHCGFLVEPTRPPRGAKLLKQLKLEAGLLPPPSPPPGFAGEQMVAQSTTTTFSSASSSPPPPSASLWLSPPIPPPQPS